ncbi:hypothetical protein F5Y11DRAFT_327682 [Daldinia sp. FL1419]|nr:hypothetical protein F5Y11DRAFT_327682 [Daldinia sp. FL1419]
MNKFGAALLLLWSLWSTAGAGLSDATLNTQSLNGRAQEDQIERLTRSEWAIIQKDENGDNGKQHEPASLLSTASTLPLTTATKLGDLHLEGRQTSGRNDKDDDDDDDGKTPKSPADVVSSLISSRVSTSVSSSVAASVSAAYLTSLAQVSESASSAISSARAAARAPSLTTGDSTPAATGVFVTSSPAASIATDELPPVAATTADVANSQESAAAPSTSAVPTEGSSLTPGAIAGLVIGVAIASSLLSAILTYLFMRRRLRQRQEEPQSPLSPTSPAPNSISHPGSRGFMNHSHSHSLSNDLSAFKMTYTSPTPTNHHRAANFSSDFTPDMKQRFAPTPNPVPAQTSISTPAPTTPTAEYPAMAQTTPHATQLSAPPAKRPSRVRSRPRPLSDPSVDDGLGPVFPVSPLSSEGDGPYSNRRSSPLSHESGGGGGVARTTSARLSLARQQSLNGGQRAQVVRVGSQRSETHGGRLAAAGQGQGEGLTRLYSFTTDTSENGNSTGSAEAQGRQSYLQPRPLVKYAYPSGAGNSSPGLPVQAPIPRRPVDPYYFEKGGNYY